jgi:HEAT repeats
MSVFPELDPLSLEDLARRFEEECPDGKEYASGYYAEVAFRIAGKGQPGVEWLGDRLDQVEGERLSAILFALTATPLRNHIIGERLAGYLGDRRPVVVAAAVDGLCRQGNKEVKDRVVALVHHPDAFVRGSVLRYLARLYPESAAPTLFDALHDPHYIVRENAIDELDDMSCAEATQLIQPLIQDPHPDVRQAAQTAFAHLSALGK